MYATTRQILGEIDRVLSAVETQQVDALLNAIVGAHTVIVYGLGREGLVMKSFAMRLAHLGVPTAVVGDMTAPPARPGDLFLVSCGPGYLSTVDALVGVAERAGARRGHDHGAAGGRAAAPCRPAPGAAGADDGPARGQQFGPGDGLRL